MSYDAAEVERLKADIAELEGKLRPLYARRRELYIEMAKTMTRRQIGAVWGISNVAVSNVINRGRYKIPKEW